MAFHKANADLAMRSAILARSRVEQDELYVGDWCFYWKPATTKLDPFRWRGPCLVVAVEVMPERTSTIYWIVHGSSLVRRTRAQLRHETVPERFERQSQPPHLEQLRQPLEGRLLRALKPVRGPVRAVDIAETKQEPSQYPAGYALADAAGDKHFDDKIPLASEDVTQNADEPMDDQDSTTRSPEVADSPETASNDVSHPPRRKHPMPEYVDPEPGGIWTDPGPPSAVTASTSASTAAAPNVENKEKKGQLMRTSPEPVKHENLASWRTKRRSIPKGLELKLRR